MIATNQRGGGTRTCCREVASSVRSNILHLCEVPVVSHDPAQESMSNLLTLWNIQDSLLQQYRVIFVTMQSILIAVGGLTIDATKPAVVLISIGILALATIYLWWELCRARGRSVHFVQHLILKAERGEIITKPLDRLKLFQEANCPDIDDQDFRRVRGKGNPSENLTRWRMDTTLPLMFALAWVLILAARFWTN